MRKRQRKHLPEHQRTAMTGDLDRVFGREAMRPAHIHRQRLVDGRAVGGDNPAVAHPIWSPWPGAQWYEYALKNRQRFRAAQANDADPALTRRRRDRHNSIVV